MTQWFNEALDESIFDLGARTSIKTGRTLYKGESPFQSLEIVETPKFGRMMILDNCVMLTEAHEYAYHEMIAHVPLFAHPNPEQVLIIGGGDGGTSREVLRHPGVKRCVMVEIDGLVVEKSREFFPQLTSALSDARMELHIADGVAYIESQVNTFDVILVDSTDPVGPAEGLFSKAFYEKVKAALKPDGLVVAQAESPYYFQKTQRELYQMLNEVYDYATLYLSAIPFYPSGTWSFAFASKQYRPESLARWEAMAAMSQDLQYFNPEVFRACFALPNFMRRNLES
ncbi:MAG: polyamine aminopropyltransferase [Microscillaceae bacterium]